MARKMTEWPSKRGPITKIMPSDGCIEDTVPLAVGKWYEFHEFGWHMGNVGLGRGLRRPHGLLVRRAAGFGYNRGMGNAVRFRISLALAALAVLGVVALPASAAEEVTGMARVIDGDTLGVAGWRFNLYGTDAPELGQTCQWPNKTIPCGDVARTALMDLVAGVEVTCKPQWKDPDGGWLAYCFADGFDLSENMVHTGWALTARRYCSHYSGTEERAKAAKRGLWKGQFTAPWDWRARGKK